ADPLREHQAAGPPSVGPRGRGDAAPLRRASRARPAARPPRRLPALRALPDDRGRRPVDRGAREVPRRGCALRLPVAALTGAALLLPSAPAGATGFTDIGEDIVPRTDFAVRVDGYLRARAVDYYNLDLDRGTTPSGQTLFPVPLGSPSAQSLLHADMR